MHGSSMIMMQAVLNQYAPAGEVKILDVGSRRCHDNQQTYRELMRDGVGLKPSGGQS